MHRVRNVLERLAGELPRIGAGLEETATYLRAKEEVNIDIPDRRRQCYEDSLAIGERFLPELRDASPQGVVEADLLIDLHALLRRSIVALRELSCALLLEDCRDQLHRARELATLATLVETELQPAVYSVHHQYAKGQRIAFEV